MPSLPSGLLQLAGCPWYAIEASLGVPDAGGLAAQPLPALDLPAVPAAGLAARGLIPGAPPESRLEVRSLARDDSFLPCSSPSP
jgi:hypothetical protein